MTVAEWVEARLAEVGPFAVAELVLLLDGQEPEREEAA